MSRHPGRLRKQPPPLQATWDYLCRRSNTPPVPWTFGSLAQGTQPYTQCKAKEQAVEKPVVSSSSRIISNNLTEFWAEFNPDLPHEDDPPVYLDDLWAELRLRTAPWGEDKWETTISSDDSLQNGPPRSSDEGDTTSIDTQPSMSSGGVSMSGAPIRVRIQPGNIHLVTPDVHRIGADAIDTPFALRLRGCDADWYERTVKFGIRLPRPANAPPVFRITKPSVVMDRVIDAWKTAGLLVPNNNLKFAMPMFLVPKPNNDVRPIIDYSSWTDFIITPKLSLKARICMLTKCFQNSSLLKLCKTIT